jgi:predicted ArsR family transcriptional regulator
MKKISVVSAESILDSKKQWRLPSSERDKEIIEILEKNGPLYRKEIADQMEMRLSNLNPFIIQLIKEGLIEEFVPSSQDLKKRRGRQSKKLRLTSH